MKKMQGDTWKIEVQKNNTIEELFIELPLDPLNQMGWDIGDTLIWEELDHRVWLYK